MTYLIAFMVALVTALVATPLVRQAAWRRGFVARPRTDRWHRRPTALLGGIAVFVALIAGVAVAGSPPPPLLVLLGAGVGIFVLGLVDDLLSLTPATKVTFHVVAASVALAAGVRLEWTGSLTLDSILTVLWFIGLTNGFNLLDNMDGACAGTGAIAALTLAAVNIWGSVPSPVLAVLALALAGALMGFLVFNLNPASIFLGDSGSLFIGFILAGLTALSQGTTLGFRGFCSMSLPILVLLVPIFDTTLVTVARKLAGRPASLGGTDHAAHRLVALGLSESGAVLVLYLLALLSGAGAFLVSRAGSDATAAVVILGVLTILLGAALFQVRVYGGKDFSVLWAGGTRGAVMAALRRHHVVELLLDVVLIAATYYAAYRLRFESSVFAIQYFKVFLSTLPVLVSCYVIGLWLMGAYEGELFRFTRADLFKVAKGLTFGVAASIVLLTYIYRFTDISRGVVAIHLALSIVCLVGARVILTIRPAETMSPPIGRPALAYGAGLLGGYLAAEMSRTPLGFRLIGFIDDDPSKHGRRIEGVPVLGGIDELRASLARGEVDAVIFSTRAVSPERVRQVHARCLEAGVLLLEGRFALSEVGGVQRKTGARDPRRLPRVAPATDAVEATGVPVPWVGLGVPGEAGPARGRVRLARFNGPPPAPRS